MGSSWPRLTKLLMLLQWTTPVVGAVPADAVSFDACVASLEQKVDYLQHELQHFN
jgi:hypothetical protein